MGVQAKNEHSTVVATWDTLRGESYDLSVVQRQDDLDRQMAAGELALGFSWAFKEGHC